MKLLETYVKDNVATLYFEVDEKNNQQRILLTSDLHYDGAFTDRKTMKKHMDTMSGDDLLFINGDIWDAMQGRNDKRRTMKGVRPENKVDSYYDSILKDFYDFITPYVKHFKFASIGNHEYSVLKHSNTDLLNRLAEKISDKHNQSLMVGKHHGWIRLVFRTKDNRPAGQIKMKYAHGTGGTNSPVTRGVIQTNRQAVFLPDADIVWNGHNHQEYIVLVPRERLSNKGVAGTDHQIHIRTAGYQQDYVGGEGYGSEKGFGPSPVSSAEIVITISDSIPHVKPSVLL